MIRLSKRLKKAASYAEKGRIIADVGCDHALLPLYLLENGYAEHAYLLDIGKEPLMNACRNAESFGLKDRTDLVLSDGLRELPGYIAENPEAGFPDTVIITGMGGLLMSDILAEAPEEVIEKAERFVLSPQSEIGVFRKELVRNGLFIEDETVAEDQGKFYFIIEAARLPAGETAIEPGEMELLYGKKGLERKDPELFDLINRDIRVNRDLLLKGDLPEERRIEILSDLKIMEEARSLYEMS